MANHNPTAPEATLRDGMLKAAIWRNPTEKGEMFSVNITRSWQDQNGQYHESSRFSPTECLKVAQLAQRAYDTIGELKQDPAASPYRAANREVFQERDHGHDNAQGYERGPRR